MSILLKPQPQKTRTATAYDMLIDGRWRKTHSEQVIDRTAPGDGYLVSQYQSGTSADAESAIAAARKAFDSGPWPKMTGAERSTALLRIAELIEKNKEEIAQLDAIEAGKPITQVKSEIDGAIDIWRYAASLARTLYGESYNTLGPQTFGFVLREPIGVISIITPWNFPFLIVSQKLPFALAAGCTAVVKPSELSSGSTLLLGRLLMQAGLPPGVVNVITGTGTAVGSFMTSHAAVDMVSFTGSTGVGRAAMANASQTLKKVSLELGGKNAQVVFPDADIEAFLDAAVFGGYFNAGQCCNAGSRLIVHEAIADEVVSGITSLSQKIRIGDPLNPETQVGAIITLEHLSRIQSCIDGAQAEGASLVLGGSSIDLGAGHYMAPTILAGVVPSNKVAREEVFGPVISVLKFGTIQQAISIANATDYGLSASVWSKDIDACVSVAREVRAGTIWINTFMDGAAELPFGGMKQSGLGRELGRHAVEDFTESKTLNIHSGPRSNMWVRQ